MALSKERKKEFEESEDRKEDLMLIHFIPKFVPAIISYAFLGFLALVVGALFFLYVDTDNFVKVVLQNSENEKTDFVYGGWPALQNIEFFKKTKEDFISRGARFIEGELSALHNRLF